MRTALFDITHWFRDAWNLPWRWKGPLLTTNIVGCEPEAVRIGMPVQATFEDVTEEISLVMFRPVGR